MGYRTPVLVNNDDLPSLDAAAVRAAASSGREERVGNHQVLKPVHHQDHAVLVVDGGTMHYAPFIDVVDLPGARAAWMLRRWGAMSCSAARLANAAGIDEKTARRVLSVLQENRDLHVRRRLPRSSSSR